MNIRSLYLLNSSCSLHVIMYFRSVPQNEIYWHVRKIKKGGAERNQLHAPSEKYLLQLTHVNDGNL